MFCNWFVQGTHWEGVSGAIRGATARKVWSGAKSTFFNGQVLPPCFGTAGYRCYFSGEIVGSVTGIVKDAGDEEAGQRLKAGATPWRDRDFATRPMA